METPVDPYEEVALVYIRLVRQESQAAAVAIEKIQTTFGSRAALRAALIVTIINEEVQRHHSIPDIRIYTYLLRDYGLALPLLQEAITRYLESEGMPERDKNGWKKWQRILDDHHNTVPNPYEDLVQQIRQHSPVTAAKLEQIYETYGTVAGDYGATALIWLQARVDLFGRHILVELSEQEIHEFIYFQYMNRNVEALERFTEMLECYRMENRPASFSFS